VVFVVLRKKKREKDLEKEAKELKTKDFAKPPEVPQGPQLYTIHPTIPPPIFPVEQQRYQPIAPPPPPSKPPESQLQPPRKAPPPPPAVDEPAEGDNIPEEEIPESEPGEVPDGTEAEENGAETKNVPKIKDNENKVPKIKNS